MESGASRCLGRTQKRLQAGQRVPLEIGLSFLFFLILLLAGCQCVPMQSKFTSDCGSRGHGTCRDPCTAHENARALFRRLDLAAVFQIYSRKWGSRSGGEFDRSAGESAVPWVRSPTGRLWPLAEAGDSARRTLNFVPDCSAWSGRHWLKMRVLVA